MPYKDPVKRRQYQKEYKRKRRLAQKKERQKKDIAYYKALTEKLFSALHASENNTKKAFNLIEEGICILLDRKYPN